MPLDEISYVYDNNDVLMNSDSKLKNVSLSITSNTTNIGLLFIDLVFNNTDIDWILLSEVDICEGMQRKVGITLCHCVTCNFVIRSS